VSATNAVDERTRKALNEVIGTLLKVSV